MRVGGFDGSCVSSQVERIRRSQDELSEVWQMKVTVFDRIMLQDSTIFQFAFFVNGDFCLE
jgi:hypothetical protein